MWAYLVGLGVVALILVTSHLPRSGHNPASSFVDGDGQESGGMWRRHLLDQEEDADPFAGTNCTPPAIEEFPRPIIPQYVRVKGGLLVHLLIAAYMFLGLSIVCDDYFVPALERMVESLQMSQDVRTWLAPLLWPPVRLHPNWPHWNHWPSLASLSPRYVINILYP